MLTEPDDLTEIAVMEFIYNQPERIAYQRLNDAAQLAGYGRPFEPSRPHVEWAVRSMLRKPIFHEAFKELTAEARQQNLRNTI